MIRPRLSYCYHAEFIESDKVLLSSEMRGDALLTGRPHCQVLREIVSNDLDLDELITKLKDKMPLMKAVIVLDELERKGYLTEAEDRFAAEEKSFWSNQRMDPGRLDDVLANNAISIVAVDDADMLAIQMAFRKAGVKIRRDAGFTVVVAEDYEHPELLELNAAALESGKPWMVVKVNGVEPWIGPLFVPGVTACFQCLADRLRDNRQVNAFFRASRGTERAIRVPLSNHCLAREIACDIAVLEIVKWLYAGANERLEGKIVSLNLGTLDTEQHELIRRPQCGACGNGDQQRWPEPIELKRTVAGPTGFAGGYREMPPEVTLATYRHLVSPITGVVQRLGPYRPIPGAPIFNSSAGHNVALRSKTMYWLNRHVRSGCGGKGSSPAQAEAGALCEAIERYCLTWHGDEPRKRASLRDLGKEGIHPNDCMNFSDKQYENRVELNEKCSAFYELVPARFDESLEMDWSPVWSLTSHRFKYLPTCFCFGQYPVEDEKEAFAYPDSNGCATGNSVEEAVLQGFLEVVERDGVAIWWYNRLSRPGVDVRSFGNVYFDNLLDYYLSIGRDLWVLDLTTDLGIPTFGAVSRIPGMEREDVIFGFGAHVDPMIAMERALLEVNQLLPIVFGGEGRFGSRRYLTDDPRFVSWLESATVANQPYLAPAKQAALRTRRDYPTVCDPNIVDALQVCIEAVSERSMETLVLDMTRPDVGLSAVRVIVPGLRHFWRRLAPGRLYDVPVSRGWMERAASEDELNPVGMFI